MWSSKVILRKRSSKVAFGSGVQIHHQWCMAQNLILSLLLSLLLPFTMNPVQHAYQKALRRRQAVQHMAHLFTFIIRIIVLNVAAIIWSRYLKQPWHTSMLTGQMWVIKFLAGHPECIHTELGVHKHVFYVIIDELHELGNTDSSLSLLKSNRLSSSIAL